MVNFDNYFDKKDEKYYDTKVLTIILEGTFAKTIEEIKNDVKNANVTISEEEIKGFLDLELDKNKLRKDIEDENRRLPKQTTRFIDDLLYSKYSYEPYTLVYFKKYTSVLKEKISTLLYIIENLSNKRIDLIDEQLQDLDIILENNKISKTDIIRLLKPTFFNIDTLKNNVEKANNVETYLKFRISLDSIYQDGFTEAEIYPHKEIQIKNLYYNHTPGNVDLSERQEKQLRDETTEMSKKILSMMM